MKRTHIHNPTVVSALALMSTLGCGGPAAETPAAEEPQGGLGLRGAPNEKEAAPEQTGALLGNEISGGHLSKEEIRKTVHANIQEIRDCYERGLEVNPELSGDVAIKFIIAKDGTVDMATAAKTSLNDSEVEKCVADAVKSWRFPEPKGGIVIVTYPFKLTK